MKEDIQDLDSFIPCLICKGTGLDGVLDCPNCGYDSEGEAQNEN